MAEFANKEIDQIEKLLELIKDLKKELKEVSKASAQMVKNIEVDKARSKQIQDLTKAQQTLVATTKELTKIEKQEASLVARLNTLRSGEQDQIIKLKVQQAELLKQKKQEAKENEGLVSAYQKQSKRLRELKNEYKDLVIQGKKADKGTESLRKEIIKLDKELRDLDKSVGDSFREIGKYENAVEALEKDLVKLGLAAGGAALSMEGIEGVVDSSEEASGAFGEVMGGVEGALDGVKNKTASFLLDVKDLTKALIDGEEGSLKTAGGLFAASLNLASFDEVVNEAAESTGQLSRTQDANNTSLADWIKLGRERRKLELELMKTSRPLREEAERLTGEIEKQNAIAGDSTRGFKEIRTAIEEAARLEVQRNAILVGLARQDLEITQKQIALTGEDAASTKLLNEQNEKQIELIGLENELTASLEKLKAEKRMNDQDDFERNLDFAVDAFDAQKTVNERLIADDRKTLLERTKIFNETVRLADNAFKRQQKLVEEFTGEYINFQELIEEKDESVIQNRIKQLDLADVVQGRILMDIIRERKIVVQDLADAERDLNEALKERQATETEAAIELATFRLEREIELADSIDARVEKELELAEFSAQAQLSQEGLLADEIKLINEQLEADKTDILKKGEEDRQKLKDEAAQKDKERLEEQRAEALAFARDLTSELGSELTERSNMRIESLDNEIAAVEDSISRQEELAAQGLDNQLAFEQERLAEINLQRKEALEQQQRQEEAIKLAEAFISSFEARVQQDPDTAIQKATQDVFVARGIAKALAEGFAYEGTEDTGGGQGLDEKNGMLWMVHPNERIMSKAQNQLVGDLTNDELASLAYNYRMGTPMNQSVVDNSAVVEQLKRLNDKPVYLGSDATATGEIIEHWLEKGAKKRIRNKVRPRL